MWGFIFFSNSKWAGYITAKGQMTDTVTAQNKCIISIFIYLFLNANEDVVSLFLSLDT